MKESHHIPYKKWQGDLGMLVLGRNFKSKWGLLDDLPKVSDDERYLSIIHNLLPHKLKLFHDEND